MSVRQRKLLSKVAYRSRIGGSQPSEDQLIDEFMDSFQDARTADQALAERRAADAELIRNMPTQPNHDRYVFPTLRPPHIAERRTYNTPFNMSQQRQQEQIEKIYKALQDKEKKGGARGSRVPTSEIQRMRLINQLRQSRQREFDRGNYNADRPPLSTINADLDFLGEKNEPQPTNPVPPTRRALVGGMMQVSDELDGGRHVISHTVRPFFAMN
jgi:hypothetical protein